MVTPDDRHRCVVVCTAIERQISIVQHLSNLSPYFHFGQLSVQRVALEIRKYKKSAPGAVDTFLEEAVVRRELSDNFCFYEPNYDNIECAAAWARDTLKVHEKDKREYVYSRCGILSGGDIHACISRCSRCIRWYNRLRLKHKT